MIDGIIHSWNMILQKLPAVFKDDYKKRLPSGPIDKNNENAKY